MPGISNVQNTVALVRFFELCVQISLLSETVFTAVSREPLQAALTNFFQVDALTQIAMMDFMISFDKMPWTGTIIAPFLQSLFANFKDGQDVYGLVQSNLVVLASAVYANNPSSFDVFASQDFLWFLRKFINSSADRERIAACDALHFLFQDKPCLVKFFAASKDNLELLR